MSGNTLITVHQVADQLIKRLIYETERTLKDGDYESAAALIYALPSVHRDPLVAALTDAQRDGLEPFMH